MWILTTDGAGARRGRRAAGLVAGALTVLAACGSSPQPTPDAPTTPAVASATAAGPVLGRADRPEARGLGTARPALIDLGGADSSGIVENISWQSWGGPTATGTGTAGYVAPGAPLASATQEQATVVGSDLGECDGHPAYRTVGWFFPQHGQTTATAGLPVCAG